MEWPIRKVVHKMFHLRRLVTGLRVLLSSFARARGLVPVALVLPVAMLAACSPNAGSRGGPIPYEAPPTFSTPDAPRASTFGSNYRISTGDMLNITVFRVDALSKDYRVDLAGNIPFPLIGDVPAVGRTTGDIREEIARRLGERYLRNPDVTVAVRESNNNNVTVEGGVRRPGLFPVTGPMSLIQSIAAAGGIDPTQGNARRLAIFRQVQGQRMAAAFDLESIRRGEMPDPEIFPGDIIVVASNNNRGLFQDILQTLPLIALFRPF